MSDDFMLSGHGVKQSIFKVIIAFSLSKKVETLLTLTFRWSCDTKRI